MNWWLVSFLIHNFNLFSDKGQFTLSNYLGNLNNYYSCAENPHRVHVISLYDLRNWSLVLISSCKIPGLMRFGFSRAEQNECGLLACDTM
jgi:hypothetical protein